MSQFSKKWPLHGHWCFTIDRSDDYTPSNTLTAPPGQDDGQDDFVNGVGNEHSTYNRQPRYSGHRPTSLFQKVLLTAGSAGMSLYDPKRAGHFLY